jgi:hypothetical protein
MVCGCGWGRERFEYNIFNLEKGLLIRIERGNVAAQKVAFIVRVGCVESELVCTRLSSR